MATDFKPADLNKDGEVTPRERRKYRESRPDPLSSDELAANYKIAWQVFQSDNELMELLQTATREQWEPALFQSQLQQTQWFQTNNEYARDYLTRKAIGGADWEATLQDARNFVQRRAVDVGAQLSAAELESIADQFLMGGWGQTGRQMLLDQALATQIEGVGGQGMLRGGAGTLQERLYQTAVANGLNLSGAYYEGAARSVVAGLTTEEDQLRDIRQQAASLWPTWSEKIMAGMDARDLASGYINVMAETFEIMPDQIRLDDPYLREAMTGVDDKGNPKVMGLWDFQKKLRNDPRWMGTKQAQDEITGIANDVLKMFGFVGA
jgi:hypothetical protein